MYTYTALPQETRRLVRAWIWFWYHDHIRLALMTGLHLPLILLAFAVVFGTGEYLRDVALIGYGITIVWLLTDNDYTNLRRIGLDEFRNPLPRS